MSKETNPYGKRDLLILAYLRHASISRSLWPYNRSLLPYSRSLLTLTHTSGIAMAHVPIASAP